MDRLLDRLVLVAEVQSIGGKDEILYEDLPPCYNVVIFSEGEGQWWLAR